MCKYTLNILCCQDVFYKKLDFYCKIFINTKIAPLLTLFWLFFEKYASLKRLQQSFHAVGENLVVVVVILLTSGAFGLF